MRRLIRTILTISALASVAGAAPVCVNGTMQDYTSAAFVAQGGCTISDKLFTNFTFQNTAAGHGVLVGSSAVNVIPDLSDPNNPGFHFTSNGWTVFSLPTDNFNSLVDTTIGFSVATISGLPLIEDNTLTLDSFSVSGSGVGSVVETQNPGGVRYTVASGGPFIDHQVFNPTNALTVSKDLNVSVRHNTSGTAQIFQFSENFSGVPEPLSFLLMGSGLLAVGFLRRRR